MSRPSLDELTTPCALVDLDVAERNCAAMRRRAQRAGVQLMQALVDEAPEEWQPVARGYLDYAVRHHDIVAAYGRFPHRNSLLGRSSTDAETEFLAAGGETFGQSG